GAGAAAAAGTAPTRPVGGWAEIFTTRSAGKRERPRGRTLAWPCQPAARWHDGGSAGAATRGEAQAGDLRRAGGRRGRRTGQAARRPRARRRRGGRSPLLLRVPEG